MKAIVVAAALACTGAAGAAEPATFCECSGRVYVHAYGPPCATAFALVSNAWSERRRHGAGPWRSASAPSWRWWRTGGGLLGSSGRMLLDASIASTDRIGSECNSRGYVESLVHRLPVRLEPTWVARGFRWWAHPNHEASTVVGIAGAAYIYVVV